MVSTKSTGYSITALLTKAPKSVGYFVLYGVGSHNYNVEQKKTLTLLCGEHSFND